MDFSGADFLTGSFLRSKLGFNSRKNEFFVCCFCACERYFHLIEFNVYRELVASQEQKLESLILRGCYNLREVL